MKLNDVLTEAERREVDALTLELEDCITDRQREKVDSAIQEIFSQAKARYYESLGHREQSATFEERKRMASRLPKHLSKKLRRVSSY